MSILKEIIANKKLEVERRKAIVPLSQLESSFEFSRVGLSLSQSIKNHPEGGVIAEFKRQSPSKGIIRQNADLISITNGYEKAGAAGISILTDTQYFGGSSDDLRSVRRGVATPILRKDFIIDEYQVYETKAMGADVILLIAANLEKPQCHQLAKISAEIGLEVLLELHDESEIGHFSEHVTLVGINNRDLKTFKVDLDHSVKMAELLPQHMIKIAESGISNLSSAVFLREKGFNGFLIGEFFMKQADPGKSCTEFVNSLQNF